MCMQLLQHQVPLIATLPSEPEAAQTACSGTLIQSSQGEATADVRGRPTSMGMLLTNHILQDGEVVLLAIKPSIWFIALSSAWFSAIVLLGLFTSILFDDRVPGHSTTYFEIAIFLIAGRVMWAVLQWMGRLYILTDLRILRLSGVFNINIFDCPLRKVARTRVIRSMRERLLRLGSIEITPMAADCPTGIWQTVSKPRFVRQQIDAAIHRAKQGRGTPMRIGRAV
jgi:hypothetical protein